MYYNMISPTINRNRIFTSGTNLSSNLQQPVLSGSSSGSNNNWGTTPSVSSSSGSSSSSYPKSGWKMPSSGSSSGLSSGLSGNVPPQISPSQVDTSAMQSQQDIDELKLMLNDLMAKQTDYINQANQYTLDKLGLGKQILEGDLPGLFGDIAQPYSKEEFESGFAERFAPIAEQYGANNLYGSSAYDDMMGRITLGLEKESGDLERAGKEYALNTALGLTPGDPLSPNVLDDLANAVDMQRMIESQGYNQYADTRNFNLKEAQYAADEARNAQRFEWEEEDRKLKEKERARKLMDSQRALSMLQNPSKDDSLFSKSQDFQKTHNDLMNWLEINSPYNSYVGGLESLDKNKSVMNIMNYLADPIKKMETDFGAYQAAMENASNSASIVGKMQGAKEKTRQVEAGHKTKTKKIQSKIAGGD